MSSAVKIPFFAVNNAKVLLFPVGNFVGAAIRQFLAINPNKANGRGNEQSLHR